MATLWKTLWNYVFIPENTQGELYISIGVLSPWPPYAHPMESHVENSQYTLIFHRCTIPMPALCPPVDMPMEYLWKSFISIGLSIGPLCLQPPYGKVCIFHRVFHSLRYAYSHPMEMFTFPQGDYTVFHAYGTSLSIGIQPYRKPIETPEGGVPMEKPYGKLSKPMENISGFSRAFPRVGIGWAQG